MPASVHSQEPQEADQSMIDAEPEVDPIMLEEKRVVVVRYTPFPTAGLGLRKNFFS